MSLQQTPDIPELEAFAIALDWSSVRVGSDLAGVGWKGVGPLGVPIIARGDGVIVFDFAAVDKFAGPAIPGYRVIPHQRIPNDIDRLMKARSGAIYNRSQYMNAWLTCYMSAMLHIQKHGVVSPPPVDPSDHLRAKELDGRWLVYDKNYNIVDTSSKLDTKTELKIETLEYANTLFLSAENVIGSNFSTVLSLLHLASYTYRIHQFSTSLLTSWAIAEQVISAMWRKLLDEKSTGENPETEISNKRRSMLTGRDYSASIVTQILSLTGKISDDTLKSLDKSRKDRNEFIHSLKMPDAQAASDAIRISSSVLSVYLDKYIAVPLSYSSWG